MVMVSHQHEFIFLKTRKTAGTSVEMYLEPFCAPPGHVVTEKTKVVISDYGVVGERMKGGKSDGAPPHRLRNHTSAEVVKETLGRKIWRKYTRLTCVRNPFDRMVSAFYWHNGQDPTLQDLPFDQIRARFRAFVLSEVMPDDTEIVHVNGRFVINDAVRFESMLADLHRLAANLGFDPTTTQLPVTKETAGLRQGRGYWDYYDDDATVQSVRKQLSWVFDRFDYPTTPVRPGGDA